MSTMRELDDTELEQIAGAGKLGDRADGVFLPPTYPGRGPQPEKQECHDDDRVCDSPRSCTLTE
jgi:hypothetical protein